MNDNVFIDTNVFVYAKLNNTDASKHINAKALLNSIDTDTFVSVQVINEFYNVLLRNKITDKAIQQSINEILEGAVLMPLSIETVKNAWLVREKYQYSYYDCMVIASALETKCKILYSEDLQHNQLINKKLRIINPFISGTEK